jgi:hypothetical protein
MKRGLFLVLALSAIAGVVCYVHYRDPFLIAFDERSVEDVFIGYSKDDLSRRFGKPRWIHDCYHPLGLEPRRSHDAPVQTLIFDLRSGPLRAWVELRDEQWTVFRTFWHHRNVVID